MKRTMFSMMAASISLASGSALADIPFGNQIINPDVETPTEDGLYAQDWFHSASFADWTTAESVSPIHSLHINDTDVNQNADWRSHGVLIPSGTTEINMHWHWLYRGVNGEFALTVRFFDAVDEDGNTTGAFRGEFNFFTGQGDSAGWEVRNEIVYPPAKAGSFDVVIRTLSGDGIGGTGATGEIFMDDIAATFPCRADFNFDGVVNSQDFFDFLSAFFSNSPFADFNLDFVVNSQDFFDFLTAFFSPCA